jgi:hypothetical protein
MTNKLTKSQQAILELLKQPNFYVVWEQLSSKANLYQNDKKIKTLNIKTYWAILPYLKLVLSPVSKKFSQYLEWYK